MELRAHTDQGTTHVCTVHRGPQDETPLQMISAQELKRLQGIEADYLKLRQGLSDRLVVQKE